ncbi:MAG: YlmC/YmxH family sporulation protein [Eubacteriaceae bacterium]|nr:YlmC/YmxH family sporulation protein [Eubacteriaceae bacterium]
MKLTEMRDKDIVNINTGQRMANFKSCDLIINETTGKIEAIVLGQVKQGFFIFANEDLNVQIPLEKIIKIGIDTIMVDI